MSAYRTSSFWPRERPTAAGISCAQRSLHPDRGSGWPRLRGSALWGFWGLGPFGVKGPVGLTCYNRYASPGHGPSHLRRILLARRTARFQTMMGERRVLAETRTTTRIMALGSLILVLRIATLSANCDNRDTAESTYTHRPAHHGLQAPRRARA